MRDSLRLSAVIVLACVLAIALLWILIRQLLVVIGLITVAWLVLRLAIGGLLGRRRALDGCPSCGREIPGDARICPYCLELRAGS